MSGCSYPRAPRLFGSCRKGRECRARKASTVIFACAQRAPRRPGGTDFEPCRAASRLSCPANDYCKAYKSTLTSSFRDRCLHTLRQFHSSRPSILRADCTIARTVVRTPNQLAAHPPIPALADSAEGFQLLVDAVKDYAIFLLDTDGKVVTWNPGAEKMKGYLAEEIIGRHFSIFYPASAVQRGWPDHELRVALAEGRFEDEGWRVRKDGSTLWANVVITTLRDRSGRPLGFAKITRDLTERRRQEETLRQSEERLRLLVEGVRDYAIVSLTPEGRIASWNSGAERMHGYTAEEIIGRHCSAFLEDDEIDRDATRREQLRTGAHTRLESEGWRVRKDGSRFWANVVLTPLRDRDGRFAGYAQVTRDLTESKRAEALERAGKRTEQFLAMLAHELRNPLAPIINSLAVIHQDPTAEPVRTHHLQVIERQALHLARLVDDLLEVSRITSGKITIRREAIDLRSVVDRAVEATAPVFQGHSHSLQVEPGAEPLTVAGDSARLAQVLVNLLNNAAKYTPDGGTVSLRLVREDGQAVLRVRDNGVGMSEDLRQEAFGLFVQGERSLDRAEGGLGVGLALARRLVALHDGTIEALSDGPGRGSEFVIRLPVLAAKAGRAPAGRVSSASCRSSLRILVVDDNRDAADSLSLLLRLWGHDVCIAYDGNQALQRAAETRPQLVLLDIGLPGIDGYEVAGQLRAMSSMSTARLVALTGYSQPEDRRRAFDAGFDDHLVKPVDQEALTRLLAASPTPLTPVRRAVVRSPGRAHVRGSGERKRARARSTP
jgi:PAS domain S-box-containing protein